MASFFPRLSIGILTASTAAIALWAEAGEPRFPWQETHARVLSHGDLEWDPRPFAFEAGDSVRYIDFENGDDANDGRTPARAWKHHPWDAAAEANAATGRRVDSYVFRRGVVYRGQLVAPESGEPGNPIRLTSDPRWGEGEAAIHGSKRISGGWRRLDPATAPAGMPEPRRVWVRKLTMDALPTAVWELHQDQIIRIHLARTPNWTISDPDDVRAEWAQWRHVEADEAEPRYLPEPQVGPHRSWGIDPELLTETDPDAYAGATVWTEYAGLMGTPYPNRIEAFDPERNAIRFAAPWSGNRRPVRSCRYFLENHPRFLDEPGEYWFDADSKRLYLRLPEDRDPNEAIIEVARHVTLIDIRGQSHIHISGLTFRFQRVPQWYHRFWDIADEDPAGVKVLGSAEDIRIANNRFEHIVRAIWIQGEGADSRIDNIAVTDNEIRHADWDAIDIRPGREGPQLGHLGRVSVLRNFIHDSGSRPRRAAHGHTLNVQYAQLLHVAGNILERTYGAGIMLWGGKPGGVIDDVPLVRMLVHHNKVVDSLLHTNDWGGIETWQGGPAYLFSNISVNPGGYWHYLDQVTDANWDSWWDEMGRLYPTEDFPYFSQIRSVSGGWTRGAGRNHASARFGFAFFMDGAFKQYLFNNIAVGKSNDIHSPLCNTAAISSVANGFLHGVFQNTFHHFGASSYRGPGAAPNHFVG
ncbi:MAG: right-handed parallel beta-helix repeat-containing protein, partial [Puniceicoccaceae bacterium]